MKRAGFSADEHSSQRLDSLQEDARVIDSGMIIELKFEVGDDLVGGPVADRGEGDQAGQRGEEGIRGAHRLSKSSWGTRVHGTSAHGDVMNRELPAILNLITFVPADGE